MMLHWAIVLLAVCVVWTKASELRWQPKRVEARPDDAGRLSRCPGSKQNFTLRWSPEDITFGDSVNVTFTITPLRDFAKGRICVKVWIRPPPSEPLIDACLAIDCTTRRHVLQKQCPFHTGVFAKGGVVLPLPAGAALSPGLYRVRLEVSDAAGKQFACGVGAFNVLNII